MKHHTFRTTTPLEIITGCVISFFFTSLFLIWYDYLWLPHIHLAYLSQIMPLTAMLILLGALLKNTPLRWLLKVPLALLLIASIILQTLVWISLVHLPLY